jgi:hypothetical protein
MLLRPAAGLGAVSDPYELYVQTSQDFRPVNQEKGWCAKAFPSWTYMPWTFHWTIGYSDDAGTWSLAHGYNGAFLDHGDVSSPTSTTGKIDWINRFQLRFYVDHLADKHYLHLWDGGEVKPHLAELHGTGIRSVPVNDALRRKLEGIISQHVAAVKSSPWRAAYALDDEISWGHFVHPTMWCVTDDKPAYDRWLTEIYGAAPPPRDKWVSYDDIRTKLSTWSIADFDAGPLMDQWTFNDAYWANFLGGLVEFTNKLDLQTPVGFVGGQCPNAFGGYDYARLMRKVQFIEAYDLGSSQAIIRSFNPRNALPAVTTHFHQSVADDVWQTWYYLAHGNRGLIGWVDGWFDGKTPKAWHDEAAPTYLEAANKIGPLMTGAQWVHDGVAIYYSHPSIQLGWVMDAQAHGKTWVNRNGDDKLGSSHRVRHAWENMLRDSGLQYNFLSYVDVIQHGVPGEYRVLILPACLCLSDAEARRIATFCRNGGTVVADYLPGLWDQHGKGRAAGGVLDEMFGVRHDPGLGPADLFNGAAHPLWCEVDQDANFSCKSAELFMTNAGTCIRDASGFNKAVRHMPVGHVNHFGKGTAVLLNLSPQWYNVYRAQGAEQAARREAFIKPIADAGVTPRARLKDAGPPTFGAEITCWRSPALPGHLGRLIYFLCQGPESTGGETGGGNSAGLKTDTVPVTLQFSRPATGVRDERTGTSLGDGDSFKFNWVMNQAVVVSVDGR